MRGFLIDVKNKTAGAVEIDDDLDSMYKVLDCNCIDVAVRRVGGELFDIVCDDNGLLKDDPIPSAVDSFGKVMLVGNLLFLHNDGKGNFTSLDDWDIFWLNMHVGSYEDNFLMTVVEYDS